MAGKRLPTYNHQLSNVIISPNASKGGADFENDSVSCAGTDITTLAPSQLSEDILSAFSNNPDALIFDRTLPGLTQGKRLTATKAHLNVHAYDRKSSGSINGPAPNSSNKKEGIDIVFNNNNNVRSVRRSNVQTENRDSGREGKVFNDKDEHGVEYNFRYSQENEESIRRGGNDEDPVKLSRGPPLPSSRQPFQFPSWATLTQEKPSKSKPRFVPSANNNNRILIPSNSIEKHEKPRLIESTNNNTKNLQFNNYSKRNVGGDERAADRHERTDISLDKGRQPPASKTATKTSSKPPPKLIGSTNNNTWLESTRKISHEIGDGSQVHKPTPTQEQQLPFSVPVVEKAKTGPTKSLESHNNNRPLSLPSATSTATEASQFYYHRHFRAMMPTLEEGEENMKSVFVNKATNSDESEESGSGSSDKSKHQVKDAHNHNSEEKKKKGGLFSCLGSGSGSGSGSDKTGMFMCVSIKSK